MPVILVVLMLVLTAPLAASDKGDKNKDKKSAEASSTVSVEDLLKQAERKDAAGDHAGALALLRSAASSPGATGEPMLRIGRVLESRNEIDAAIDAYKAAAAGLAGAAKGEALARESLLQEIRIVGDANATAQEAAAADPDGAWTKVALARARARQKKGDEAKALADGASSLGAVATAAVGFAEEARTDDAAAEAAYRKALAAEAGRIDAAVGLARVLRRTSRAAEAEPLLQAAIAAAPGAVAAYQESARVKAALGRMDDASSDAVMASTLAEGAGDTKALAQEMAVEKAVADALRGGADFAIQDLNALREQDPKSAVLLVGLARVQMVKRDAAAASASLKEAVTLAPDSAEAHFQTGYLTHVLKKDAAGALPELEKAVELAPDNLEYRTHLGAVLSELQKFDRAEAELLKVTGSPGLKKADAWIYLGGAYLNAKKYSDAVGALGKALAISPDVQMANAYMAWSYLGLKDAENFKKYGGKARSLGYKDTRFLDNLTRVEAGEKIK
jgi:tetratricopeptide (TPR) repeat protein